MALLWRGRGYLSSFTPPFTNSHHSLLTSVIPFMMSRATPILAQRATDTHTRLPLFSFHWRLWAKPYKSKCLQSKCHQLSAIQFHQFHGANSKQLGYSLDLTSAAPKTPGSRYEPRHYLLPTECTEVGAHCHLPKLRVWRQTVGRMRQTSKSHAVIPEDSSLCLSQLSHNA